MKREAKRFHLISLGCPKNLVDSECLFGQLALHGWLHVSMPEDADVLIINTCGFIQSAVEESIEEILQLAALKQTDPQKKIVVVGCLVQRYGQQLAQQLPEVDLLIGTEGGRDFVRLLDTLDTEEEHDRLVVPERFLMDATLPRQLSTPSFRAWLKVTEGCDNCCSYCLIPAIRGPLRSREVDDLVREAARLENGGVRELSLVAQDLTAYGQDRAGRSMLTPLLKGLLTGTSIEWVRLMYLYPSGVCEDLLELVASSPRIVPYFDIPLQHVSDSVLRRMNRRYGRKDIDRLLQRIRSVVPGAALRTTIMVGFPGETDKDFEDLLEFLRLARFNHLGAFAYANEEGCAAEKLDGQVENRTKEERLDALLSVQAEVSAELQQGAVGSIETVLVEGVSRETDLLLEGRTRSQAPEIDGCVLINEGVASPGDFVNVEITEAHVYDLIGRIVT